MKWKFKIVRLSKEGTRRLWNLPSTIPDHYIRVIQNGDHVAAYHMRKDKTR